MLTAGLALAILNIAGAATASRPTEQLDPARTYVVARAAALSGDHGRSAELLARLAESDSSSTLIARRAVAEAINAGNLQLALRLIGRLPQDSLPVEARLLLTANQIKANRAARGAALLAGSPDAPELSFLRPYVIAWAAAERGNASEALAAMASIQSGNLLAAAKDEHMALLLLKLGRPADADPYARRAVASAGGREQRLRLAFADGFLAARDSARVEDMLGGLRLDSARARQAIESGRPSGLAIDSTAEAFSELLLRLAIELNQINNRSLPVAVAQVARYVAPENHSAALLLGVFLESRQRVDDALAAWGSVRSQSALGAQARDLEVRALLRADRGEQALRIARDAVAARGSDASDHARLGDALSELKRYDEAAYAYRQALALAANARPHEKWPLYVLQANALERGERWPEARAALQSALALAPDQPIILNFLGYAKLERGEDLDLAEAMIRKASQLAPNDAAITDSLGWALFKRGKIDQAIDVLNRAARADPSQAEIHEHLGDALYSAGRKFEARFAWQAALTVAEDDTVDRIKAKIESGLTPETAAP